MPEAHILVVDDDPNLLRSVRLSLVLEDFSVETARDGLEALEKVDKATFDLIVLDLQMPRMDGRTFYREMRSLGLDTPVVVLSAYGAEAACAQLGADGAVAKPFDPDRLLDEIRRLLGEHGPEVARILNPQTR